MPNSSDLVFAPDQLWRNRVGDLVRITRVQPLYNSALIHTQTVEPGPHTCCANHVLFEDGRALPQLRDADSGLVERRDHPHDLVKQIFSETLEKSV